MFKRRIHERSSHFLISGSDDLVQFKLNSANEIVDVQIIDLLVVIYIVYVNLEFLLFLKVILTGYGLDPVGVQIIVDDLSLP
jgi:hypothetical protein